MQFAGGHSFVSTMSYGTQGSQRYMGPPPAKRRARSRSASAGVAGRSRSRSVIPMDIKPSISRGNAQRALMSAYKGEQRDVGAGYALSLQALAASIVAINLMVQGDLNGNRDGSFVTNDRINLSYTIETTGTVAAPLWNRVVCALLWDKQANGALPTEAQVLETPTAGNEVIASMPNQNFKDRFEVLYHRVHTVSNLDVPSITTSFSVPLNGRRTNYVAAAGAGTIADIITGSLIWFVKPDVTNVTYNAFQSVLFYHP